MPRNQNPRPRLSGLSWEVGHGTGTDEIFHVNPSTFIPDTTGRVCLVCSTVAALPQSSYGLGHGTSAFKARPRIYVMAPSR